MRLDGVICVWLLFVDYVRGICGIGDMVLLVLLYIDIVGCLMSV